MNNRCLYCYQELQKGEVDFHTACCRKIFETNTVPEIPYTEDDMLQLAEQVIKSQKSITGVQAKLSLGIQNIKEVDKPNRFTIVGLWGAYILKPASKEYQNLPEIEDLTMRLAELSKIDTVKHSLIRLKSNQLAYITKRVDRDKDSKLHMEDMCQLTERLTEHKYKGSYEQIGRIIRKYSSNPGLNLINFYELVLFSFLTGNNDMHLKNFSLLKSKNKEYNLCPAYDLVASELVVEGDDEELALNLNGKKKKIKRLDFQTVMLSSDIEQKVIENIFKKYSGLLEKWYQFIDISFLPENIKQEYRKMIDKKFKQLGL